MNKRSPPSLPHQIDGTAFLEARDAAALFDEQGLGKSKQLVDAVAGRIAAGTIDGALIVCPNILKSTWAEEIERHSRLTYSVFGSGKKARREPFRKLKAAVYVINYEAVPAEMPSLRALLRFRRIALILDESHRIKTPNARVTRSILALRHDAASRYIMSGTPVANRPEDLWSQIYFLDDGAALGRSPEEFKNRYGGAPAGYKHLDDLRAHLHGLALRRRKAGTIALPPKTVVRVPVKLTGLQRSMYDELRQELRLWVQGMSGETLHCEADHVLARLVRLAQLASNPRLLDKRYDEAPSKFEVLDQVLAERLGDEGAKAIVWTSFVGNIRELVDRYRSYHAVAIHGEVGHQERDVAIKAFKADLQTRLLVANPAAAREGLTLTEARTAIYLDRTFNLVDYLQSQDRIHRISQQRPCELILLIGQNTIDELVDFCLAQKQRVAECAQGDSVDLTLSDLSLDRPAILKALLEKPKLGRRRDYLEGVTPNV